MPRDRVGMQKIIPQLVEVIKKNSSKKVGFFMPVKPFDPKNEKIENEKLKEARIKRIFKKERSLIIRRTSVDSVLDGSFVSEHQRIHSEM